MTISGDKLVIALVAILIIAGGALKLLRYTAQAAPDTDTPNANIAMVTAAMAADGWQKTGTETGPRIPFTSIAFAKHGCDRQITISILGDSLELIPLARRVHGDDVVFHSQSGVQPGDGTGPLAIRLNRAVSESGITAARVPLLAIAPASALSKSGCAVPL